MKTKTIELYEFEELPADVQEKVIENQRNINVDDDQEWYDFVYEEWKEKLEAMGFESPEISFSGFWNQGDGASFTCKNVDIQKFLKSQNGEFKNLKKGLKNGAIEVNASVIRISHHYDHENTVEGEIEVLPSEDNPFSDTCITEGYLLSSRLTQVVRDLSRKIYRDLEKEFNDLTSDESVKDTILANEYTFTINGKMENL